MEIFYLIGAFLAVIAVAVVFGVAASYFVFTPLAMAIESLLYGRGKRRG